MSTVHEITSAKLLVPKIESNHVFRERLTDTLHENIQKRLQVISAPAGYGKTVLLTDFARSIDIPVCWYSFNTEDEDPRLFLEGIHNSVASCFPAFGKLTASCLSTISDITKEANHIITVLANDIKDTIPDYLVVVFEDYHVIENSTLTKNMLNLLLEKAPENCHFIISGRTQVDLPVIPKLVLKNQFSSLTMSHLSFSKDEIKSLAATCFHKNLSDEDAGKLAEETGGWAISLMLHLNHIEPNGLTKLPEINQDQVFNYLTTEVFLRQPEEIQKFLLVSSTVTTINPELIEQLIPDVNCHKAVKHLKQRNLFLQCVDEKKKHYRYHQLFKDFLQEKLMQDDLPGFKLLHYKAASLYEKEGNLNEAIEHYHKSIKYHDIIRLIKEHVPEILKASKWIMIQRWLGKLPQHLITADPELVLLDAQCMVHLGDTNQSQALLTDLLSRHTSKREWLRRAKALSWRGAAFRINGHFNEAKTDIFSAIHILKGKNGPPELFGACHRRLGDIYKDQGQFSLALKHLRLAQKYYASVFDITELSIVHNSLGVIYKRLGQLSKAKMHFEKARVGLLKISNYGELAITLNNIGLIYQRFGQYDLALETFSSGIEKAKETGYLRIEAVIKISIADVLRELCRYNEALDNYKEGIELARQAMEPTFIAYATAGIGETYRLLRQYDRAKMLLEEARHQAEDQQQPYEIALFDVQLGIIAYETGQLEQAKKILDDAYQRLQSIGDKDAMAKAGFHLAQVSFLSREYNTAAEWLKKASDLADELGYENFLVVEGRQSIPLIHHGAALHIGDGRFQRVLEKIKTLNEVKQQECVIETPVNHDLKNKFDIKVRVLGVIEVTLDNRQINDADWRSKRAKEIFFYLLTHPEGKTSEQISSVLWPDLSPAKGSSNFHINLFRARQALFPGIFILENGKYTLNPDISVWFDVTEFERSLSLASKNLEFDRQISALEYAIELYTGPFLPGFYNDWIEERRRELENTYLKAVLQLAEINAKQENYGKAINLLEKYIAIDPYQEDIYYRIMRLHIAGKNKPLALRTYKQYLDTLSGEEIEVSLDIKNLYKKLLI